MRRATASIGAARRPLLAIVQPSADRVRLTCSVPIAAPRTKIVRVVALASGARCCADARPGAASSHTAARPRIEWEERMPQHSIAYQAARERAAFVARSHRARIVVSGAD